jgi:hypothetical protein
MTDKPEDDDTVEHEPVEEYTVPDEEDDETYPLEDDDDDESFFPNAVEEDTDAEKRKKHIWLGVGALVLATIVVLAFLGFVGALTNQGAKHVPVVLPPPTVSATPTPKPKPSPVKTVTVTAKPSKAPSEGAQDDDHTEYGPQFANAKELIDTIDPTCGWVKDAGGWYLCPDKQYVAFYGDVDKFMASAVDNPDFQGVRYIRGVGDDDQWIFLARHSYDVTMVRIRIGGQDGRVGQG